MRGRDGAAGGRGQAAVELALSLMVLALILGGVLTVGPIVYASIGVQTAAGDCAFAAAQTLDPAQGRFQGIAAAQETLASYNLRESAARIQVYGDWRRGSAVTCRVEYTLNLAGVPMRGFLSVDPTVSAQVALPAQAFKSVWR